MSLYWPHKVRALPRSVRVEDRRGVVPITWTVGDPDGYIFTMDAYSYQNHVHPDRHLGWWRFALPPGRGTGDVHLDFSTIRAKSVSLIAEGRSLPVVDSWYNPDYAFDPLVELQLVVRDRDGVVRRNEPVLLKFVDRDVLRSFYARQYATCGYASAPDAPFLPELHRYKMGQLRRLFDAHIPAGGRAIDVGCGRSLFADLGVRWPFKVFSGDLDFESVHARADEVPQQAWSVFDAGAIPFADGQFDALFAGEIIEHVPDVPATLQEWRRVLKPGGVAIITTPNRERLLATASRTERPYSVDHLSELSYRELAGPLLHDAGFEVIGQRCLYLEICLKNVFSSRPIQDHLQTEGNHRGNVWLMRRLYPLGRFLPRVALIMIVIARKRA